MKSITTLKLAAASLAFALMATPFAGTASAATVPPLSRAELANATYPVLDGETVTLANGKYQDTQNRVTVMLGRERANGDLNGDGVVDSAVTLYQNNGGSGTFTLVSAVLNDNGAANPVSTVFLGDRVPVRSLRITSRGELLVTFLERKPGQPMSARPSVPVVRRYKLVNGQLIATFPVSQQALANAEYPMEGVPNEVAPLINGKYTDPETKTTVTLQRRPQAVGDMNGDRSPDTAVLLIQNTSGSGTFTWVSLVLNEQYRAVPVVSEFIGDRVVVQSMTIWNGVLVVRYLDRKEGEPMSAKPSVPTTKEFTYTDGTLAESGQGAPAGSAEPAMPQNIMVVQYVCADNKNMGAAFSSQGAVVAFGGKVEQLKQKPTASGFEYANDAWNLRGKGNEAQLTDAKTGAPVAKDCLTAGAAAAPPTAHTLPAPAAPMTPTAPAAPVTPTIQTLPAPAAPMTPTAPLTPTAPAAPVTPTTPMTKSVLSGVLTGTVTYLVRSALPPNAVVSVQLADVSKADAAATVVATQTIQTNGKQVPIPYELKYDPAKIDERMTYAVSARITVDGKLYFVSTRRYAVLTRGSPVTGVEILVEPVM